MRYNVAKMSASGYIAPGQRDGCAKCLFSRLHRRGGPEGQRSLYCPVVSSGVSKLGICEAFRRDR